MSKLTSIIIALFIVSLSSAYAQVFNSKFTSTELNGASVKLIPYPHFVEWGRKEYTIKSVSLKEEHLISKANKAELDRILKSCKIDVKTSSNQKIIFQKDLNLGEEHYYISVQPKNVIIQYSTDAGLFYALQTLRQLIVIKNDMPVVASCTILDKPAHKIRGFMTDVGRNFQSISFLKKIIDVLAMYKLNVFHWHLTDYPAWRIESKKYPQLTAAENHRQTRNPGKYYTYNQIRDVIEYAKAKQIQVIPEIDMPGHSDSFTKAIGHKMETEKGINVLKNVLNEFFAEIPKELCPIIHIGSDEVKIERPDEFIQKMVAVCESNGRKVVVWNPGLKANQSVIRQTWKPDYVKGNGYTEIDSWNNYINNGDPFIHISKLFFKPIGHLSKNNVIGGILCLWHDVNVDNENEIIEANPVFPSILTYAWTTWTADITSTTQDYRTRIPLKGTKEHSYFSAFEKYLIAHKNRFFKQTPFQYVKQATTYWELIGAFNSETVKNADAKAVNALFVNAKNKVKAQGNTIYIRDRFKLGGYFPKAKPNETYFAKTIVFSEKNQEIEAWIGFETAFRANRVYGGIPQKGKWDVNGGTVWVNGKELDPPAWENPGWKPSKTQGWGSKKDQETPWESDEFYWTRKPVKIMLQKGNNEIIFRVPGTNNYQNWMFTFALLQPNSIQFVTSKK